MALQIKPSGTVLVPLRSALNRILAENIVAETDLPGFDRSAVDGYALRAEDTIGATQFKPSILRLTNKNGIENKQTRQVWTGNPLPERANAVVMLENTEQRGSTVEVWSPMTPGENVSKRGEDIKKGEIAAYSGTRLKPQHLGLIAALGAVDVKTFEKPKIAIVATGNELIELGGHPRKDQIFDTSRLVLSALCDELGAEPVDLGIARDSVDEIARKLKIGLEKADGVLTSGGTSVGGPDLVPDAVNKIGKPGIIVHGIAMRPGMPTALAVVNGKPVVILPGNPVAAMLSFEVFMRPLIGAMLGLKQIERRFAAQARVTGRIFTTLGRKAFVRVHVVQRNGELIAEPISVRGSSMISTMTRANGYVIVPENREGIEGGETVDVNFFDSIDVVGDDDFQKTDGS
jgi:molybdopterin molybdotransferase